MPVATKTVKHAGLRYVSDSEPGIARVSCGKRFRYIGSNGLLIRSKKVLSRIRSLVLPPAWTDVWICASANGHLQATGRDARSRKQFKYHPRWCEIREQSKYNRVSQFAKCLSQMRQRLHQHLKLKGLPREKVLATVVLLLESTQIRIGNEEYVQQNHSYGLTTLRVQHVKIDGSRMRFQFKGKSGIKHSIQLNNSQLSRIVKQCQELPGQELFQYLDDSGNRHVIASHDVNDYIRQISGGDFTAKDYRTWAGTIYTVKELQRYESFQSEREAKQNLNSAIDAVSKRLGNTKAVCRKCYVHPAVIKAYLDGELLDVFRPMNQPSTLHGTTNIMEKKLVRFLEHYRHL